MKIDNPYLIDYINLYKSRDKILITCSFCENNFLRFKNEIQININKKSSGFYCSRNCINKNKIKGKLYNCNNCLKEVFKAPSETKSINLFCSQFCSGTFNSKNKKLPESTKKKISNTLKSRNKSCKIKPIKYCKTNNCNILILDRKQYCNDCKLNYYKLYRPSCEFDFELKNYKNKIEGFDLIDKYGKYSPSNKGNNLIGATLDHIYSVKQGFINKISPDIIKHPANCRIILFSDNSSKNIRCDITLEELKIKILNF